MPRHDDHPPTLVDIMNLAVSGNPADADALIRLYASRLSGYDRGQAPSRVRPAPQTVTTYRLRVAIDQTSPQIWRRLELASDMRLSVVHDVLQVAFGWTDSHLHRFGAGASPRDRTMQYFLTYFDLEEGESGVAECDVRLDQVLRVIGDRLFYNYDFGDDWFHTLELERVLPLRDAPRGVCTGGRRAGPPEDVGGLWGLEQVLDLLVHPERGDPDALERLEWLSPGYDPAYFDPGDVNPALHRVTEVFVAKDIPAGIPRQVAGLVEDAEGPGRGLLVEMVTRARLDEPATLDAEAAAAMVGPYSWLLGRVGDSGIALTAASMLPPAVVVEAVTALGLEGDLVGKLNRESQTYPVRHLRESAQMLGLLRQDGRRLVPTEQGAAVRADPGGLLALIAAGLPIGDDDCELQAGMVLLLCTATNDGSGPAGVGFENNYDVLETALGSLRWTGPDGHPLTSEMAGAAARPTHGVLHRLGILPASAQEAGSPTPAGRAFAGVALRSWTP